MKVRNFKKNVQAGFTLVELIIVIVIVGILAAVAIPKLTDTSTAARAGVSNATLGALKSAWSAAYAKKAGVNPSPDDIAAQMADPACVSSTTGVITCTGVTTDGATATKFTAAATNTALVATPSTIVITP